MPGAAGIVPKQGITDDLAIGVQKDHAVLLTTNRDGSNIVKSAGVGNRSLQGIPPETWVYLGAVRMTCTTGAN
jgi:hypothetical protein